MLCCVRCTLIPPLVRDTANQLTYPALDQDGATASADKFKHNKFSETLLLSYSSKHTHYLAIDNISLFAHIIVYPLER